MPTEAYLPESEPPIASDEALLKHFELFHPYLLAFAREEWTPELNDGWSGSDLVQETYMAAHRQWKQFRGSSPRELLSWLRAILRFKILRHRRKQRARLLLATAPYRSESLPSKEPPSRAASPDLEIEQQEDQLRIFRLLHEMPELQQQIIEGRIERDETFIEIGTRLGMTADAVRKSFSRAIQHLRSHFEAAVVLCVDAKQADL